MDTTYNLIVYPRMVNVSNSLPCDIACVLCRSYQVYRFCTVCCANGLKFVFVTQTRAANLNYMLAMDVQQELASIVVKVLALSIHKLLIL